MGYLLNIIGIISNLLYLSALETNIKLEQQAKLLLFFGIILLLFGLVIGFFIPMLSNPRMVLSAHLEGAMNGIFLVILGLIWNKLILKAKWLTTAYWLSLYGSFANFLAVTMAAITGAGRMLPIAGGKEGITSVGGLISFLLVTLSLAMILV